MGIHGFLKTTDPRDVELVSEYYVGSGSGVATQCHTFLESGNGLSGFLVFYIAVQQSVLTGLNPAMFDYFTTMVVEWTTPQPVFPQKIPEAPPEAWRDVDQIINALPQFTENSWHGKLAEIIGTVGKKAWSIAKEVVGVGLPVALAGLQAWKLYSDIANPRPSGGPMITQNFLGVNPQ